jgi:hypothetical protein
LSREVLVLHDKPKAKQQRRNDVPRTVRKRSKKNYTLNPRFSDQIIKKNKKKKFKEKKKIETA